MTKTPFPQRSMNDFIEVVSCYRKTDEYQYLYWSNILKYYFPSTFGPEYFTQAELIHTKN